MGRKKIEIKLIQDERTRLVTFAKRKSGLLRKAYELSVLCDCEIAILIFSKSKRLYQYASKDMNVTMHRYIGTDHPHEYLRNDDIQKWYNNKKTSNCDESGDEKSIESEVKEDAVNRIDKKNETPKSLFENNIRNEILDIRNVTNKKELNNHSVWNGTESDSVNVNIDKNPSTNLRKSNFEAKKARVPPIRQNSDSFSDIPLYSGADSGLGIMDILGTPILGEAIPIIPVKINKTNNPPLTSQISLQTPDFSSGDLKESIFNQFNTSLFQEQKQNPTENIVGTSSQKPVFEIDPENSSIQRENSITTLLNEADIFRMMRSSGECSNFSNDLNFTWAGVSNANTTRDSEKEKQNTVDIPEEHCSSAKKAK